MRGTITNINHSRGCGFILPDAATDNREVYFEQDAVRGVPFSALSFGDRVIYEAQEPPATTGERQASRVERDKQ